jgi:carbonyl reductase 1
VEATKDFLSIMRDAGRLVNVSSTAGKLSSYSKSLQERFRGAREVDDVDKLMEDFKAAVAAGNEKEQGWISAAYATSKAGLTTATRVIAEKQSASGSKTLVNACCPGYVKVTNSRCISTDVLANESNRQT